ncbi:asialoglycoprotein receptor 2-like [Melanotaenia boesemani]|uniref:asialoglycoprotein receptor 2-like n=1 Tax=Melanotaenia boesemani TaxID=1250792 RepID=UPI001C05A187|nr:asialoglycoprotein receptor 2-like [Melanotaenia boesemani]
MKDRDLLKANLSEMAEKLNRLHRLFKQNKTCPAGWSRFSCSCYILSNRSSPWHEGREFCRNRGADLVVIENNEEQEYLSKFTDKPFWMGLNSETGIWKWVDGSPLILTKWATGQPDNGGGKPEYGEENCAHVKLNKYWNDLSCKVYLRWLCEKLI